MLDEPNGDSSIYPTWSVSNLAAEKVKVAISGDGADELFLIQQIQLQSLSRSRSESTKNTPKVFN